MLIRQCGLTRYMYTTVATTVYMYTGNENMGRAIL